MNAKNLLFFVVGAAIGSIVTYKLTEKKLVKEFEEELQKLEEDISESKPMIDVDTYHKKVADYISDNTEISEQQIRPSKTYHFAKPAEDIDDSEEEENEIPAPEYMEDVPYDDALENDYKNVAPKKIKKTDFEENYQWFEKEILTYYSDGVLLDENDAVTSIDETITKTMIDEINFAKKNSILYVRCQHLKTDYEIHWVETSYADYIGEVGE